MKYLVVAVALCLAATARAGQYEDMYNQQQQFRYQAEMRQWQQQQEMRDYQDRRGYQGGGAEMPLPPVDITPPVRTDRLPDLP
jgi:hypothetical protein